MVIRVKVSPARSRRRWSRRSRRRRRPDRHPCPSESARAGSGTSRQSRTTFRHGGTTPYRQRHVSCPATPHKWNPSSRCGDPARQVNRYYRPWPPRDGKTDFSRRQGGPHDGQELIGLRLAPPISPPSTSGSWNKEAAFSGFDAAAVLDRKRSSRFLAELLPNSCRE